MTTADPIDWDDVEHWGGGVHHATTDDLGDHGRHCDETKEDQ